MKTSYEFKREVGQVAGGDIQSNTAQAHVDLHIHHSTNVTFITERQRSAINRKAYQIEVRTGTDKLMVYRRLMSVFGFARMDSLPRDEYARVMSYLDAWLRSGTAPLLSGNVARNTGQRSRAASAAGPKALRALGCQGGARCAEPAAKFATGRTRTSWRTVVASTAAAVAIGSGLYFALEQRAVANAGASAQAQHCEYDGTRYSIGSVVLQAGARQRCATTLNRMPTWQPHESKQRR